MVLALGFCKASIAYFIMRLTPQTSVRTTLNVFLVCTFTWMIGSIFAFALQCNLSSPWSLASGACDGVYRRVLAIGILDIILEIALFACAILLVLRLQTKFLKKSMVVIAFGLRLPIIAIIAVRLKTFNQDGIMNFSRNESLYIVWSVTQINFSLISTTLPILRPFIKDLSTFYGALRPSEYSGSSRSNSYPLSTFRTKRSDGTQVSSKKSQEKSLAREGFDSVDFGAGPQHAFEPTTTTEIRATSGPSRSPERVRRQDSLGQDDMFIQVDTQWEVSRGSPLLPPCP